MTYLNDVLIPTLRLGAIVANRYYPETALRKIKGVRFDPIILFFLQN